MEDALGVQVAQPPGDVEGQLDARGPGEEHGAVQQLLQVAAVDVLMGQTPPRCTPLSIPCAWVSSHPMAQPPPEGKEVSPWIFSPPPHGIPPRTRGHHPALTSVNACSCPWCTHTPMNLWDKELLRMAPGGTQELAQPRWQPPKPPPGSVERAPPEDVGVREAVHQLHLPQHVAPVARQLVHLQHHDLPRLAVPHLWGAREGAQHPRGQHKLAFLSQGQTPVSLWWGWG